MNIKKFLSNKKNLVPFADSIQNPYVKGAEGRREWNDRYDNMRKSIGKWQKAFFCSIAVSVILAIVVAKMAGESRLQPFVVETSNGMPVAVRSMQAMSLHDERLTNFAINQFIVNARTIVRDAEAQKTLIDKVYAFSANDTIGFLRDYYQKNDPWEKSGKYTVTVKIINSMAISKDTWQVTWDETSRSASDGSMLGTTRWMANLTWQSGEINPQFINDNPFGSDITQVSWSQSHQ